MTEPTDPVPKPPRPSPEPGVDAFGEFMAFRRFAMPVLVQLVFWGGTIASLVWGVSLIEAADRGWQGTSEAMVWAGIGVIVLGPALLRIAGELIMVVFRIHEGVEALRPNKK
jgi:hypothetical protein